ncbi:transporter substrate-binding domain-containing protein [Alteromonas halophila]|uniref:ABC transporter substrate-binding protein n=1 Tax=Alteromonas halophila TaxID=516698 RepID=A0A918JDE2_9ALTE|nr:transporter substrate-binding domain-containing protein [Alteromonas halophila]GGW73310.1 hypothetical protein GCM10007391_01140 [Alteromonas halophila]
MYFINSIVRNRVHSRAVRVPLFIAALFCFGLVSQQVSAQQQQSLQVGTKVAPPFVLKSDSGELEGISIELWRRIADDAGLEYQFTESELDSLIADTEGGQLDASVAALTVNAEREARIDFSHPFYTTGLAIAVPSRQDKLTAAISGFFSWEFFVALSGLCLLLFAVGALLWVFERKRNAEMFGGTPAKGLGSSFWWAAVTMTTVGYGDKAPVTLGGRIIGFIWMFAAIIIISSFTAAIATSLTVSQLETDVQGVDDLPDVRVATLANSASAIFLDKEDISYNKVSSVSEGLKQLKKGKLDAFVYDKPIMQFYIKRDFDDDVEVLPEIIERQDYAIALPENSPLRERINTSLLRVIERDDWEEVLNEYLGK